MPYPYEETRELMLAVLRVLTVEQSRGDGPHDADHARDLLEEKAQLFAGALDGYRQAQRVGAGVAPNRNRYAAGVISSAANIASGRGELGLANQLWAFEERLRAQGREV